MMNITEIRRPGALEVARTYVAKKALLRRIKTGFAAIALVAMGLAVWRSWDFLRGILAAVDAIYVVAAVLVWMVLHFLSPLFLKIVLGRSRPLGYRDALGVHALRLPSRYLPGGIWHTVARVADLSALGYPPRALTEFVLLENLVAAGFALGVGGTLLLIVGGEKWRLLIGLVSLGGFIGLVAAPYMSRLLSRSERSIPTVSYLWLLLVVAFFWTLASFAFVTFVNGFRAEVFDATILETAGVYLFSWGVGFVTIFAPQGIGVFEYVSGALLSGEIGMTEAVSVMASFRVVVLLADLGAWGMVSLALGRRRWPESRDREPGIK